MTGNYSEALEQQVDLWRWHATSGGRRWIEALSRTSVGAEQMIKAVEAGLSYGEPFYWAPDLTEVVVTAAKSLPQQWCLTPEMLPEWAGFFWFARPLPLPPLEDSKGTRVSDDVVAISWARMTFQSRETEGIGFIAYTRPLPHHTVVLPAYSWAWLFGESHVEASDRDPLPANADSAVIRLGYFAAALAFLNQRILVAPHERAERHARRRLERDGWTHEPLIRVVQLRRKERQGSGSVQPTDREYHCQWVVRGHWRQHWYPKQARHQPRWIMPHVKGPDDKPLKAPRATVFAVVR